MTLANRINQLLFDGSPYDGLDLSSYPLDLQGWCDAPEVFDALIDRFQPRLIIEVGSWKGTSAHYMIKRALLHKDDAAIICIDTWLGSTEHWLYPKLRGMLKLRHGRPTLHEQFMANVVHAGLQERIVPLPLPSRLASMVLAEIRLGGDALSSPLVYIDGAHDEVSVREDIAAWWPFVTPGGLMLGDDYARPWTGVINAVAQFRTDHAEEIAKTGEIGTNWFAEKNGS
jgi:hypothetical protein